MAGRAEYVCGGKDRARVWGKDSAGVEAGSRYVGDKGKARVIARVGHA